MYIEACRGGYHPPAVYAVACGYSLCRGRRLDDPLTRQRHRKSIYSSVSCKTLSACGLPPVPPAAAAVRRVATALTYVEPCGGGYHPPAVYAVACGYSLCRGRRLDDPLTRQRHRKSIYSSVSCKTLSACGLPPVPSTAAAVRRIAAPYKVTAYSNEQGNFYKV